MKYGSLQNLMMGSSTGPEPEVGMGATILMWSDRRPATIIGVTRFKTGARAGQVKTVTVRVDKATRVDSNGMSDAQSYTFEPDPDGAEYTFAATKSGGFKTPGGGYGLRVGSRSKYYDYSF